MGALLVFLFDIGREAVEQTAKIVRNYGFASINEALSGEVIFGMDVVCGFDGIFLVFSEVVCGVIEPLCVWRTGKREDEGNC